MSPEESINEAKTTTVAESVTESGVTDTPPATPVPPSAPSASVASTSDAPTAAPAASAEPVKPASDIAEKPKAESDEDEKVEQEETELKEEEKDQGPAKSSSAPSPPPAQTYYPPPRHESSVMGVPTGLKYPFFLHNNFLMLFIIIGMIFTLIGGILSGASYISSNKDIYGASVITISLGLFTISTFLILAALFREDLDHFIRLGLLITGAFAIFGLVLYSRFGFGI